MRLLIVLIILSGAGYYYRYRSVRYEELTNLRAETKNIDSQFAEKTKLRDRLIVKLTPLRSARDEATTPGSSLDGLTKAVEELQDALKDTTVRLDNAETEFASAVEAVREAAKKQTLPVIKLPSGDELKDCTISKFGEGYISITHSQGISKIQSEDLPAGWSERYALDYVSREEQAEKDALSARIAEATLSPLDLKKAQLSEVEEQLEKVTAQLLAMSSEMRDARRKADKLVRDAYRIALQKGEKGDAAVAQRTAMFNASRKVDAAREVTAKKYRALRAQKLELEEKRNSLKRRPST